MDIFQLMERTIRAEVGTERLDDVLTALTAYGSPCLQEIAGEWLCDVELADDLITSDEQPTPLAAALQCCDRVIAALEQSAPTKGKQQ